MSAETVRHSSTYIILSLSIYIYIYIYIHIYIYTYTYIYIYICRQETDRQTENYWMCKPFLFWLVIRFLCPMQSEYPKTLLWARISGWPMVMFAGECKHFPRYWPLCSKNPSITGVFYIQKASNAEYIFKSWHLHCDWPSTEPLSFLTTSYSMVHRLWEKHDNVYRR